MLNLYLNERLKVAADEIFQVIKDTILEYQNEIALTKEENRDLKQRLSDVGTISAGIQRGNTLHLSWFVYKMSIKLIV